MIRFKPNARTAAYNALNKPLPDRYYDPTRNMQINAKGVKALNEGLHNGTIWFEKGTGFVGRSKHRGSEDRALNEVVQLGWGVDDTIAYLANHPTPDTW